MEYNWDEPIWIYFVQKNAGIGKTYSLNVLKDRERNDKALICANSGRESSLYKQIRTLQIARSLHRWSERGCRTQSKILEIWTSIPKSTIPPESSADDNWISMSDKVEAFRALQCYTEGFTVWSGSTTWTGINSIWRRFNRAMYWLYPISLSQAVKEVSRRWWRRRATRARWFAGWASAGIISLATRKDHENYSRSSENQETKFRILLNSIGIGSFSSGRTLPLKSKTHIGKQCQTI